MDNRSISIPRSRNPYKSAIDKQEILELKKTVTYLENYLIQVSEERDLTIQQLKSSKNHSEELQEKLKQESISKSLLKDQINHLNQEVTSLNIKIFTNQENSAQVNQEQVKKIAALKTEILRINEAGLMLNEEKNEHRRHSLKLSKKIKMLFKALQLPKFCLRETLDPNLGIAKTKEFILKFPRIYKENHRLHEENQKLFQRIDRMESFQEASEFNSLVKDSNGLSYFKNKVNCGRQTCPGSSNQVSDWIPKPVFSALEEFKSKHDQVTTNAVINIFYKLNQIWQERENNRIQRLKNQLMSRSNFSESNVSYKKLKKPEKSSKTKEKITKEYQNASNKMVNVISEYYEVSENHSENTQDCLAESVLQVLSEYTNKILVAL